MQRIDRTRRRLLQSLGIFGGLLAVRGAGAHHTDTHWADRSTHQIIYQCNEADPDYLNSILFSIGELVRKYEDEVHVIVACFGKGIHLLAKNPGRPIPEELQQRASSLSAYGVWFHACENTMKSLGWTEDDMVDYARIVPIGVDDIMLWQEKGYAYFRW